MSNTDKALSIESAAWLVLSVLGVNTWRLLVQFCN